MKKQKLVRLLQKGLIPAAHSRNAGRHPFSLVGVVEHRAVFLVYTSAFLVMKTLLFTACLVAASVSTAFAQSQTPAAADSWLDTPATTSESAASAADVEDPQYNTGWSTAPGQSLSLHGKPTTDYWGRPLKKKAKNLTTVAAREAAYAEEESADPMMQSSGVMVAPGMSSSPYRGVSTDYWGRPLKKKAKNSTLAAKNVQTNAPVSSNSTIGW